LNELISPLANKLTSKQFTFDNFVSSISFLIPQARYGIRINTFIFFNNWRSTNVCGDVCVKHVI